MIYEIFNAGEWYDRTGWSGFQRHFLRFFHNRTAQPLIVNDDRAAGREFRGEPLADMVARHRLPAAPCPPLDFRRPPLVD